MTKKTQIESTAEAWETRQLGADEDYVEVVKLNENDVNASLDLQPISIRLQKSLIEDLKIIAKINGLGYQPLIRQVLTRFAEAEKKHYLREMSHRLAMEKEVALPNKDGDDKKAACG